MDKEALWCAEAFVNCDICNAKPETNLPLANLHVKRQRPMPSILEPAPISYWHEDSIRTTDTTCRPYHPNIPALSQECSRNDSKMRAEPWTPSSRLDGGRRFRVPDQELPSSNELFAEAGFKQPSLANKVLSPPHHTSGCPCHRSK